MSRGGSIRSARTRGNGGRAAASAAGAGAGAAAAAAAAAAWEGASFTRLGSVAQAPYQAFRSVFGQFVLQTPRQHELNRALRSPDCSLRSLAALTPKASGEGGGEGGGGEGGEGGESSSSIHELDLIGHAHFMLNLRGPPPTLALRHRASGEIERLELPRLHATFWIGGALVGAWRPAGAPDVVEDDDEQPGVVVLCRVPWSGPPSPGE